MRTLSNKFDYQKGMSWKGLLKCREIALAAGKQTENLYVIGLNDIKSFC